ncbi:MAG: homoserine dehydrogenase [Pseudomonadota bacterium]
MASGPLRIGVCGNGTVGGGVIALLQDQASLYRSRCGRTLELTMVGARRDRDDCLVPPSVAVERDLSLVASARDLDVVVECIGGTELAAELVRAALSSGKSVVTANKALIAEQGNELYKLAEDNGVSLLCEAAVAGGVPIIKALREGMAANCVSSVTGIINGTGNFILSDMAAAGRDFAEVLAEAQALGYAEADPTFDVEGIDAAHKLAILASIAFAMPLKFEEVYCEGISQVTPEDLTFAEELGYCIKHLGIAKQREQGVELRVHPTLLPKEEQLASVDGVLNAVRLEGHAAGATVYSGAGAGRLPTASAVLADLIDLARSGSEVISGLGTAVSTLQDRAVLPMDDVRSAWYLRLNMLDQPGVMSQVASCLGAEGVSIEALIQRPPVHGQQSVSVVVVTNEAREQELGRALDAINALEGIASQPYRIRVEG